MHVERSLKTSANVAVTFSNCCCRICAASVSPNFDWNKIDERLITVTSDPNNAKDCAISKAITPAVVGYTIHSLGKNNKQKQINSNPQER